MLGAGGLQVSEIDPVYHFARMALVFCVGAAQRMLVHIPDTEVPHYFVLDTFCMCAAKLLVR